MKQLFALLAFLSLGLFANAQTSDTLALDSIHVELNIKVSEAQLGWSLINDIDVRSAITAAVGMNTDTSAMVAVKLTGAELVRAYEPIATMPLALVRKWADVLEAAITPYLVVPENYLLLDNINDIEQRHKINIEYRRLEGAEKILRQAAAISRNQ